MAPFSTHFLCFATFVALPISSHFFSFLLISSLFFFGIEQCLCWQTGKLDKSLTDIPSACFQNWTNVSKDVCWSEKIDIVPLWREYLANLTWVWANAPYAFVAPLLAVSGSRKKKISRFPLPLNQRFLLLLMLMNPLNGIWTLWGQCSPFLTVVRTCLLWLRTFWRFLLLPKTLERSNPAQN